MRGDSLFPMSMDPYDSDDEMASDNHHHHLSNSVNKADARKSNKPIMENRRRARINNCLNDLKGILLEAMKKDPARHSKLEKADILELTVRHLQNIQRNQLAVAMATDPTVLCRFKNGFSECASEVGRYLSKLDGVEEGMKSRVATHLTSCVGGLQQFQGSPTSVGAGPVNIIGGNRYGSDVPFVPFSPPIGALIPPSNLTPPGEFRPPGDLNNNKNKESPVNVHLTPTLTHHHHVHHNKNILVHRPVPINPLSSSTTTTTTIILSPPSLQNHLQLPSSLTPQDDSTPHPVDYSTHQIKVETTPPSSLSKDSMWRPW